jgi:competence protein ComEC
MCPGACSAHCACPGAGPGDLRIHLLDVGQGDAILVVSPDGFVLLVDAGPGGNDGAIEQDLRRLGVSALDYVLVSHLHADHVGSMPGVLDRHPEVSACFDHGAFYDSSDAEAWYDAAGTCRQALHPGDVLDLGPSVETQVLHGNVGDANENVNSLVLRIAWRETSVLLGGDCETWGCEDALEDLEPTTVYKVHHHGSSNGSAAWFLDALQPAIALIPVGADNGYGHPDEGTLRRLQSRVGEENLYRTDEDGDVDVTCDGSTCTAAATR